MIEGSEFRKKSKIKVQPLKSAAAAVKPEDERLEALMEAAANTGGN